MDLKTKKASVLLYSLVLVFILIIMAVGAASVMLTDKKSAISSREGVQAFQNADSGVEKIRRKIKTNPDDSIGTHFTCSAGIIDGGSYTATLYLEDDSVASCTANKLSEIRRIKSNGTYAGSTRAIEVAVAAAPEVPTGGVMAFALSSCPSGWNAADGSGSTPDLRGMFIRGRNDFGTGARSDGKQDPSGARTIGDYQGDSFVNHSHTGTYMAEGGGNPLAVAGAGTSYSGQSIPSAGGDETRPKNVALIYCVKN